MSLIYCILYYVSVVMSYSFVKCFVNFLSHNCWVLFLLCRINIFFPQLLTQVFCNTFIFFGTKSQKQKCKYKFDQNRLADHFIFLIFGKKLTTDDAVDFPNKLVGLEEQLTRVGLQHPPIHPLVVAVLFGHRRESRSRQLTIEVSLNVVKLAKFSPVVKILVVLYWYREFFRQSVKCK